MSDCCTQSGSGVSRSATCPVNGQSYRSIEIKTLLHQLRKPWQKNLQGDYFYCSDPACDVMYYNEQGQAYCQGDLRTSERDESSVCYCFDVSVSDLQSEQQKNMIRDYIIQQTKNNLCECSVRNPSGQCCLKDIK